MIKFASIIILLLSTILFGEVIDRGQLLMTSERLHLEQLASAIEENCSITPLLVYLSEDEQNSMTRISSGYGAELNIRSDQPWILATLSPNGTVKITIDDSLEGYYSDLHLQSFSHSAENLLHKSKIAQAGENLLLNFTEVIAQKEKLDFGAILTGKASVVEESEPLPWWLLAIPLLLFSALGMVRTANVLSNRNKTSSLKCTVQNGSNQPNLFGGNLYNTKQSYFGGSLEKRVD